MKNLFYAGLLALVPACLPAQNNTCLTSPADLLTLQNRLQHPLDASPAANARSVTYIPVRFHLVADDAGAGRPRMRVVLDQLCALNADYAPGEMQFYLHGADLFDNTINNDLVNENVITNSAQVIMSSHRDTDAVNIFVVKEVSDGESSTPFIGGYYDVSHNWIVATKATLSPPEYFVSHTVGHYFGLLHPFHGWEMPFTPSSPGWPQAPATINGYPVELMDGSNCTEAGDQICDTPPDYGFGIITDCQAYTGGALDPNGVPVDPMENNMMGYFSDCDDYQFTPGQFAVMNAELASSNQAGLDVNFTPVATEINTPNNLLVTPPPNFFYPGTTNIDLDWLDVPGATHYLVELDLTTQFTSPLFLEYLTTNSEFAVPVALSPNKYYHWRVRPFNAYVGCATPVYGVFKTGPSSSGVQVLDDGSRLSLSPNPVAEGQAVQVQMDLNQPALTRLTVINPTGQQIWTETRALPAGLCQWALGTEHLVSGLNWVKIDLNGQTLTQAIIRE